jgi:hypothetical protein
MLARALGDDQIEDEVEIGEIGLLVAAVDFGRERVDGN